MTLDFIQPKIKEMELCQRKNIIVQFTWRLCENVV